MRREKHMVRKLGCIVRSILLLLVTAGWLLAAPSEVAQPAPPNARAVLTQFLDALIERNAAAALALVTDELRAQSPNAFVGASNPCSYRYEVLAFEPASATAVVARSRIYQHLWGGDNAGGLPSSFVQEVSLVQTAAGWRVNRLGSPQNTREE